MGEEREYSFYGFHGTAESCARKISEVKKFIYGTIRNDHWLGKGAYFFKDDEWQAKYWAYNKVMNHEKFKGEKPYVVEVIIDVKEQHYLNLDSRAGLWQLDQFLKKLGDEGLCIFKKEEATPEIIRCFLLSLLPESIWVIQRTFYVPSKYDEDSMFNKMGLYLQGTQICVRNNKAIRPGSIKIKEVDFGVRRRMPKSPRRF